MYSVRADVQVHCFARAHRHCLPQWTSDKSSEREKPGGVAGLLSSEPIITENIEESSVPEDNTAPDETEDPQDIENQEPETDRVTE